MIEDSKVPDPTQELSYTVDFVTDPAGANVFFDGVYKGVTPHTLSGVTRGTHDVLYSCPGYTEVRQEILVTENTALRSTLTKEVFESHPVKIETLPDGAKIYINGQYRGVSPLQIHLMDGTYKLSSSLSGYQTANLEIEVPRDEQVSLSLDKGEDTSSPAPIFGSFGTRKAVIYGGIVTAFLVVLAIILVVIMAAPVPSSPMTLQQSVATAGNSSPVVQAPRPTLTPAARPTLAVTPTTSTTSPAHLVKQLKLPANNQVFEYRVVKPPMTVSWDVTPTMTTRDTCYENARGVFVCKDLTRIDENSIFTIRITDRDTNEIVLEDGFSPRFGTQLSKTQRIYRGGSFNISIDGRSIGVTLRIDQSY